MAKKKSKSPQITKVKKGEHYETRSGELIEVTNGRLKQEAEHGASFAGRTITFNPVTGEATPAETAERFFLEELQRKLSSQDFAEWVAIQQREAEAVAAATAATDPALETPVTASPAKPRSRMSQLDAAAKVLAETGTPMTAQDLIAAMAEKGYWTSPGGKMPQATLYSAMLREIQAKGDASRFARVDRGLFTVTDR